jgi:6,7-dimethyl-8-ribityllumazine synthase
MSQVPHDGRWWVVASRFNEAVTERLANGAEACLRGAGIDAGRIERVRVPGAWELGLAVGRLLELHLPAVERSTPPEGVVALGAIVRGETPHFDYICTETSRALMTAGLQTGVPIGFGLLTCDDMEQALARAGGDAGNKGFEAARAALDLAAVSLRPGG